MEIITLAPTHALDAARLHIAGQPGTFLTSLGPEVLTVFYRALPQSATAIGFAAHGNTEQKCQQVTADNQSVDLSQPPAIIGFVAATTCTGCLFFELATRHLLHFFPPLLLRYGRQPGLIWRSIETLFYPFSPSHRTGEATHKDEPTAVAELLSIMVEPGQRNQGIGAQLVAQLVTACQVRKIGALDVTVDADNVGAQRFYAQQGFVEAQTFQLYGRAMARYRLSLLPPKAQTQ